MKTQKESFALTYKTSIEPKKNFIKTYNDELEAINSALDFFHGDFGVEILDIKINGIPFNHHAAEEIIRYWEYLDENPLEDVRNQ